MRTRSYPAGRLTASARSRSGRTLLTMRIPRRSRDENIAVERQRPERLLAQVVMPGWVDLHVRKIGLPTESARRYALVAVDAWQDPSGPKTGDATGPDTGAASRADIQREVRDAARAATEAQAARAERLRSPQPTDADMTVLRSMHDSLEGKLAYASVVVAAEIEQSPVWADDTFVGAGTEVDLAEQVTGIVGNCSALLRSKQALGPRPAGALADDRDVRAVYERRTRGHEERLAAIVRRLDAFLRYRDHIRECEPLREKFAWIEAHDVDDESEYFMRAAEDHFAGSALTTASEEVIRRIRVAAELLGEGALGLSADTSVTDRRGRRG